MVEQVFKNSPFLYTNLGLVSSDFVSIRNKSNTVSYLDDFYFSPLKKKYTCNTNQMESFFENNEIRKKIRMMLG